MVNINDLFDEAGGRKDSDKTPYRVGQKVGSDDLQFALAVIHAYINKSKYNYLLLSVKGGNLHVALAEHFPDIPNAIAEILMKELGFD